MLYFSAQYTNYISLMQEINNFTSNFNCNMENYHLKINCKIITAAITCTNISCLQIRSIHMSVFHEINICLVLQLLNSLSLKTFVSTLKVKYESFWNTKCRVIRKSLQLQFS
jgi:hypothetical protein